MRALVVVVSLLVASVLGPTMTARRVAAAVPVDARRPPGAFVPVTPCRLVDTRPAPDGPFGFARLDALTIRVRAAGRCGVDASATAIVLSVASVGSTLPGFVTVFPAGSGQPLASNLNYRAGDIRANAAVVAVGDGASFDVYTTSGDLVVDVTGWFRPATTATAGRFVALTPHRVVDSRVVDVRSGTTGVPVAAGSTMAVPLPAGVPADAWALSVNITVTESAGAGFVTVHPAGTPRPLSSSLNVDGAGQTRAAGAIVPVSRGGFLVYLSTRGHVVVDVNGYVTGPSAPPSDAGLFVPADRPTRLLDTRDAAGAVLAAGDVRQVSVPAGSATTVFNLTAVGGNRGYVTAWPSGSSTRPVVSSLNSEGGDIVANLVIVPASDAVQLYSQSGTHLVADIAGWFVAGLAPRPVIALTFDDGPGPYTPALLEVLARHRVRATMFMIGQEVDRRPSVAAAVAAAGHRIGNHSARHADLTALTPEEVRADLTAASESVRRATGVLPTCMRPPQGRTNAVVDAVAAAMALSIEQGTVDGGDWRIDATVDEVIGVLDAAVATAGGGAGRPVVVTLHDAGGDRTATVEAVDRWLAAHAGQLDLRVLESCR